MLSNVVILDFPGDSMVKNPPPNAGDAGLIPGSENPLGKEEAAHSSILGKSQGQRSLVDDSPQGRRESGTTGRAHVVLLTYMAGFCSSSVASISF